MTPTWYDLLGVEPDASADEIRAAWKAAIADLDPTDRRFRTLNEAAEVLLDPDRRSEYDAGLEPEPDSQTRGPGETEGQLEAPDATQPGQDSRTTDRRTIPAWLLVALAILTAAVMAFAGYLSTQPSDAAVADSTTDAQSAAERAVTTILAYDYRHLEDDQMASDKLMTASYQKKYDALFTQIAANAPDLKAVVTVDVVASGIVRSGDDRVQVLVFVNRPTTRSDGDELYRDQVVVTMQRQDGRWLVDDMATNALG